jgi:hypothetical protein
MRRDGLELLITVVVGAEGDGQAREACHALLHRIGGRIIESSDCSDEEPGCWSVTISQYHADLATPVDNASLANAVRRFMRGLGPDFATSRVSCEPPTAWTVLDDPELVEVLVPGGERMLVEVWAGRSPLPVGNGQIRREDPPAGSAPPVERRMQAPAAPTTPQPGEGAAFRLRMRVDVAADRAAGAEWQARALASRIAHAPTITETAYIGEGLIGVDLDLGAVDSPSTAVRSAVEALHRPGWQPLSWVGDTAIICWVADPRPASGITALEISAGPPHPDENAVDTTPNPS